MGFRSGIDRRADLKRAALNAEWDGANGKYASVIRQLRHRGTEAAIRATWIYRSLLVVILLGLTFYLGLPYWERYVDGTREALEKQKAVHLSEHLKLDKQRADLIAGTTTRQGLLETVPFTPMLIPSGVEGGLREAIVDGQNILLFGGGSLLDLTLIASSFRPNASNVALNGVITRSTNGGESFTAVPSGVESNLYDAIVDGQNILLFGGGGLLDLSLIASSIRPNASSVALNGVITRSTDGGESFTAVPSGVEGSLQEAIVDGQNILLFGTRGAITRSTNGGESFTAVPSGVEDNLTDAIVHGQNILLMGEKGSLVAIEFKWTDRLKANASSFASGSEGDVVLAALIDEALPNHIQTWAPIADLRRALSIIQARRDVLKVLDADTREKLNTLKESPALLKREEVRETFAAFLTLCRGESVHQELTKVCIESWQAQQAVERENWWQTLAVQVPPGILLLFLLATLGALYRYSLRMAGFYHSRADALELLLSGMDEKQNKVISALASDLAADKVEFGKANTPTDQAVELAKAVTARG